MDVRQLRYFISIVDFKSMSKAAERLHVAQPALSQQIASLEADLDVQLLVRSTRGVDATAAGMTLYRHAQSILRQMDDTRRDVKSESRDVSGHVAIGMPTTTAAMLGVPLLRAVRERYPRIRLQLFESMSGYLGELLGSGRLDIAVLFRSSETRDVSVEPLFTEELFHMGNVKGRRGNAPLPITRLAGLPLVLPSAGHELRLLIERAFARAETALNVVADVDSLPTILACAAEGLAGTILPHSALGYHYDMSMIACRSLVPSLQRTVSVCRLRHMLITSASDAVRGLLFELTSEALKGGKWKGAALAADLA